MKRSNNISSLSMKNGAHFLIPGRANPTITIKQRDEPTTKKREQSPHPSFCYIKSTKDTKPNSSRKNIAAVFDKIGGRVDKEIPSDPSEDTNLTGTDYSLNPDVLVLNNNEEQCTRNSPMKVKTLNKRKFNENNRHSSDDEIDYSQLREDIAKINNKKKYRRKLQKNKRNTYLTRNSSLFYKGYKKYNSSATSISTQTDPDITSEKVETKDAEVTAKIMSKKEFREFCCQNQEIGDNPFIGKHYTEKPTSKLDEIRKPNGSYQVLEQLKRANEDGTIRCMLSSAITFTLLIWLISEVLHINSPWDLLGIATEYFSSLPIFASKHKYAQELTRTELAIRYFGNIMNNIFGLDKK